MYLTPEQIKAMQALGPAPFLQYPLIHLTGRALSGLVQRTVDRSPEDRRWTAHYRDPRSGKYYRLSLEELDAETAPPPHKCEGGSS